MFSKSLVVGVLAAGCLAAAAGGAFLAVRQNAAAPQAADVTAGAPPAQTAEPGTRPVAETEAVISADPAQKPASPTASAEAPAVPERRASAPATAVKVERETARASQAPRPRPSTASTPPAARERTSEPPAAPAQPQRRETTEVSPPAVVTPSTSTEIAEVAPRPETPPAPQFDELTVPASSVIGLRVETPISTERAQVEDRVNARVTRDVMADGRVAIPAGAQAIGSVTLVERGGKIKDRARLGVRFHTLVLADGTELPITTEAIYREGEPPSGESARKIGGAAAGGAILGAIIGGKKGAIVGATTGAAGGTAVVMAGDRNAATLPTGTIVTVRLAAPVAVEVEKQR